MGIEDFSFYEKKNIEAKHDADWWQVRNMMNKIIEQGSSDIDMTTIAFFCLNLVITELELYKDKFKNVDEEIKKINKNVDSVAKFKFLAQNMNIVLNISDTIEKRQLAIERIRLQTWNQLLPRIDILKNMVRAMMEAAETEITKVERSLLQQCVGQVSLELSVRDLEMQLINN